MTLTYSANGIAQSNLFTFKFQRPTRLPQRCPRAQNVVSMGTIPKSDCVAVALELEGIREEMQLVDQATEAAGCRVLLALLGERRLLISHAIPSHSYPHKQISYSFFCLSCYNKLIV